jgi:uncharacterized protein (TIGR04255 family)
MTELLNVTHQPRKSFRKHFLVSVYSEIGFSALPLESILGAQKTLEDVLPNLGFIECRQVMQSQFTFEAKVNELAKLSQEASPLGLLFISQTPRRDLQILSDRITYSDFSYDGFENFLSRFKALWDAIASVVGLTEQHVVNKVGLRKINSIVMEPVSSFQDALSVFNPALFNTARSGLVVREAFKVAEEVTVLDRDGNICLLRTKLQKRNENGLEANLDFDFVNLSQNNFAKVFTEVLPALNQGHFDLFMWAVTSELIKLMEAE